MDLDLSLYFIADPATCGKKRIEDVVEAAIKGGATIVQYRNKSDDLEHIYHEATLLRDICDDLNTPFIVNDHVEIARNIFADGVHIGQGDSDVTEARDMLGPNAIIGLTAFTPDHIKAIDPDIVDYIGTGPVYPTLTDKGKPILGLEGFAQLAAQSPVPVVAIGGINANNAEELKDKGAAGIAVMRSIAGADNPREAAKGLKAA